MLIKYPDGGINEDLTDYIYFESSWVDKEYGIIDINNKDFNKLRIWQDINKDGISQTNELKTLDELNIKSLNLKL